MAPQYETTPWVKIFPGHVAQEPGCAGDPVDDGKLGLRIAALFIILAASALGALAPISLARQSRARVPKAAFFVCKYVGTGVIIATAWLHLLAPAVENLGDPCLEDRLGDYPWPFAIGLWTVMAMFFIELMAARKADDDDVHLASGPDHHTQGNRHTHNFGVKKPNQNGVRTDNNESSASVSTDVESTTTAVDELPVRDDDVSYPPGGRDHLSHRHEHTEGDSHGTLAGQLTSIFILEFGVVLHSIFIGLTLGTTKEVEVLLAVLIFHQLFEGLGLGSRLAISPWPPGKKWLPYLLGVIFALSTPLGIAVGVRARPRNAGTQKLINGIFDSISAGILMYTGLVELLAHEFMFNQAMRKARLRVPMFAFACVLLGMGVMALLAKWA
ncbi:Zinc-regulated transporter-like protein [Hapsidospora chrysogenum ATCC 11550]|uniref:Zinc-regulated transporter-like protein n=1 Tax=Hapsidospora chrysogenum (strain ATCC 11550 / CBS 779.69 / DSM 880 / IAM 14645 / JCM 23072 / IMI 49137) TaxID=857340 RepID=A0A086SZG6_HAPC1|nr:Zinc-regulated transporter-like protein [Hapsidospora chrysogenum ATCC 11550]